MDTLAETLWHEFGVETEEHLQAVEHPRPAAVDKPDVPATVPVTFPEYCLIRRSPEREDRDLMAFQVFLHERQVALCAPQVIRRRERSVREEHQHSHSAPPPPGEPAVVLRVGKDSPDHTIVSIIYLGRAFVSL